MRVSGHSAALGVVLTSAGLIAESGAFVVLPRNELQSITNSLLCDPAKNSYHKPRSSSSSSSSSSSRLFGIMDEVNSDAFDLLGGSSKSQDDSDRVTEAYEIFLAELVFSPNDPRMDIAEKADRSMDPGFMAYLDQKVATSTDPEEKVALRDLYEMIVDVREKLELRQRQLEREEAERAEAERQRVAELDAAAASGRGLSDADVLRRAQAVDNAGVHKEMGIAGPGGSGDGTTADKQTFYDAELSPEIRSSYEKLLKKLLPPYKGPQDVTSVVQKNYDKVDAQLIKVLNERSRNGDADSQAVLDAVAQEQEVRMAAATDKLKQVLGMGDPARMEGKIVQLAKEPGQIDEAFLLLLQANADQAQQAGATGPAQLMYKLKERALQEKDKNSTSKEVKLIRQLLRTEQKEQRERLLEDAFTPRESLLVPGSADNLQKAAEGVALGAGAASDDDDENKPMPDVSPPDFINACKAVLLNFGNIGDGQEDLSDKIQAIAAEAEVVATRIYGAGMSNQEQQDRMWKDCTTSIFDLETMEIEAERQGEKAPWTHDGDEILPGFDADGRMKVGGG